MVLVWLAIASSVLVLLRRWPLVLTLSGRPLVLALLPVASLILGLLRCLLSGASLLSSP